jgi:hypothetical protein
MTLHAQHEFSIPEETARVARAAYPKGNLYMHMRDALGTIYQDESFAHLFPQNGRPVEARLSAGIHYGGAVHRGTARSTSRRRSSRTHRSKVCPRLRTDRSRL